jgi:hypothetical protein
MPVAKAGSFKTWQVINYKMQGKPLPSPKNDPLRIVFCLKQLKILGGSH